MKTIGLLGGMSWESTALYYDLLNRGIKKRLGGLHSAKIVLYSVDFQEIEKLQRKNDWQAAGEILSEHAQSLENAGADFILICTNTMHKVAQTIQNKISIPLLHIAESTAEDMVKNKAKKAILLGTRFTMQENFIKDVISSYGIEVITPCPEEMKIIDDIIFNELVLGNINEDSKRKYLDIINNICHTHNDIDALILGCTEIGLLIKQEDTELKLYDTLPLHVDAAIKQSLSD